MSSSFIKTCIEVLLIIAFSWIIIQMLQSNLSIAFLLFVLLLLDGWAIAVVHQS